jgi:hypothetical protein
MIFVLTLWASVAFASIEYLYIKIRALESYRKQHDLLIQHLLQERSGNSPYRSPPPRMTLDPGVESLAPECRDCHIVDCIDCDLPGQVLKSWDSSYLGRKTIDVSDMTEEAVKQLIEQSRI